MKMIKIIVISLFMMVIHLEGCSKSSPPEPSSPTPQKEANSQNSGSTPKMTLSSTSNSTFKTGSLSVNSISENAKTPATASTANSAMKPAFPAPAQKPGSSEPMAVNSNGAPIPSKFPGAANPNPAVTSNLNTTNRGNSSGTAHEYSYISEGRKDPFMTYLMGANPKRAIKTTIPLLNYSLSDMKLVAVMVIKKNQFLAMVETPDLKGYIVKPGMEIGMNRGRVHEITDHSISVEEEFTEIGGEKKRRTIVLSLHPPEEGQL
ncbi:MAG: pilus assembly protein PilP [Nitrospiria bacterium]